MRSKIIYKIFTILFLCISATTRATNYYVSPSGNNNNSGTSPSEPWQTISKVNSVDFEPGDCVFFEGGQDFFGGLIFNAEDAGTLSNPVTVGSYGSNRAIINSDSIKGLFAYNCAGFVVKDLIFIGSGRTDPNGDNGITFYMDQGGNLKREYIHINNVKVSRYYLSGIEIGAWHSSGSGFKDVKITNSEIHDNGDKGISFWGYWPPLPSNRSHKDVYVGYCKVYNITGIASYNNHTGNGIVLSSVDSAVIEYCEAFNNGELNSGSQGGPVGIWAWESNNVIIQFCESHHNKTNNNKDGGGFDLDGGCVNSFIQYNYSHDNAGAGYGIYQFAGASQNHNNIIRYNISENDGLVGGYGAINFWSTNSNGGIQNSKVYNNTLYVSSNTNGAGIEDLSSGNSFVNNTEIYNNVIVTDTNKTVVNIPDTSGGWSFKGNCYWTFGSNIRIMWGGTLYNNLSTWCSFTGQEMVGSTQVGLETDPKLTDVGNGGTIGNPTLLITLTAYKLKPESPVINAGLDLLTLFGINPGYHDFYTVSIPQFIDYDIGAHESEQLTPVNIYKGLKLTTLELYENFPNPFNPTTTISYFLPEGSCVRIVVYDIVGRKIAVLVDDFQSEGKYSLVWDGKNQEGINISSGFYICKIEACEIVKFIKMIALK